MLLRQEERALRSLELRTDERTFQERDHKDCEFFRVH